ncbi:acyl-CoA dehydrogenase family protein [Chelatococcus reniformis]|uniref:Dibenzothiophene monooxygenase n=1 Tax=Chelatococcus reniformis TaxID=1494448 RepID=A0A916UAV7_9HYPH|nr:acyl-CoA dehydrogenase family protein [Chelatococcus reniformis]GGC65480.1 FMNH2-dependent monooxygenase [Chelatococcus reniformis]
MSFDLDTSDPYLAAAAVLRERFAVDAVARDKQGGRPAEQLELLRASGLLSLTIPTAYGGQGQPWSTAFRITREFAKVDGSFGHLFGYHFGSVHGAYLGGSPEQAADLYRRAAAGNWFWGNARNSFSRTLFGRRDGAHYVLDGYKPFTSGSHIADYLQISWLDPSGQEFTLAAIPTDRAGLTIHHDWDGIGQRQTGSGRVSFDGVRVHESEVLDGRRHAGRPFQSVGVLLQQSTLLNVFIGSAQGALIAARDYTREHSRPWIYSGVAKHTEDPWVKRTYDDLYIRTQAATLLADRALNALDQAWGRGFDLTESERGEAAIAVAAANALAGETALEVTSKIFEVMGARSATTSNGFDRFWRNVRIHALRNPAEYKIRNVGTWFLDGTYPEPGIFQ